MAIQKVADPLAQAAKVGGRTRNTNDTFQRVYGKRDVSAAQSLSRALGGLTSSLDGLAQVNAAENYAQDQQDKADDKAGGAAAYHASKVRLGEAVKRGDIDAGASPAYREGYADAQLRVMASEYVAGLEEMMGKTPSIGEDSAAFNAAEQVMFQQYAADNFAGKPMSDAQIMNNFMSIRDAGKAGIQASLIKRNNAIIKYKAEEKLTQEMRNLVNGGGDDQEVAENISAVLATHRINDPLYTKKALASVTDMIVMRAVENDNPKMLSLASRIKTGSGKLGGTVAFRKKAERARNAIRIKLEQDRVLAASRNARYRAEQKRVADIDLFNKAKKLLDSGAISAEQLAQFALGNSRNIAEASRVLNALKTFNKPALDARVNTLTGQITEEASREDPSQEVMDNLSDQLSALGGGSAALQQMIGKTQARMDGAEQSDLDEHAIALYKESAKSTNSTLMIALTTLVGEKKFRPSDSLSDQPRAVKDQDVLEQTAAYRAGAMVRLENVGRSVNQQVSRYMMEFAARNPEITKEEYSAEFNKVKATELESAVKTFTETLNDPDWLASVEANQTSNRNAQLELPEQARRLEAAAAKQAYDKQLEAKDLKEAQMQAMVRQNAIEQKAKILKLTVPAQHTNNSISAFVKNYPAPINGKLFHEGTSTWGTDTGQSVRRPDDKRALAEHNMAQAAISYLYSNATPKFAKNSNPDRYGVVTPGGTYVKPPDTQMMLRLLNNIESTEAHEEAEYRFGKSWAIRMRTLHNIIKRSREQR